MKSQAKSLTSLVHIAAWIKSIGGVETLLALHAERDQPAGFSSVQLGLFDKDRSRNAADYSTQAFSGWNTPRQMKAAMATAQQTSAGAVTLWHNGWGISWFADKDQSSRRIVCLWDSVTHFESWLSRVRHLVDGVICMSDAALADVRRLWPELPAERLQMLAVPIEFPSTEMTSPTRSQEWVIGCGGRLVHRQKRAERLVPFVQELRRLGLNFRLEVVSDGPLRETLEQQLQDEPRVRFLGWQSRKDYWARLASWDAAIFFTDHEGGPIVLLEAMAAGVLPVFPQIGGSLADDYLPQVDARCAYPAGDVKAAAQAMKRLMAAEPADVAEIKRRARTLAMRHTPERYHDAFSQFVRRIEALPRISQAATGPRRWRWWDRLPLGLISRFYPTALWK
jgi:glycosyltransferase involved in cell wall biosynthesis